MKRITKNTYKMKDYSVSNLKSLGFHYNKEASDTDRKCYSLRFPVLKYNEHANIMGEVTIDTISSDIIINVYDLKGKYYAPFYDRKYGGFDDILKIINSNIMKQLQYLKIYKKASGISFLWMKR